MYGQEWSPDVSTIEKFLKTKTWVVYEDNPFIEYNTVIEKTMQSEWNLTPYGFISITDFETMRRDPDYSFLVLTEVFFEKDRSQTHYDFLSILLGGSYYGINDMPEVCLLPLSYADADEATYIFKLPALLRYMQGFIEGFANDPGFLEGKGLHLFNKFNAELKDKTILMMEQDLAYDLRALENLEKIYPFSIDLVDMTRMEEAIMSGDENVVLLHKVGPGINKQKTRCFKILMGANDGKIYYFDFHMVNNRNEDAFLRSDFNKILRSF
jgi:hypothetical protein